MHYRARQVPRQEGVTHSGIVFDSSATNAVPATGISVSSPYTSKIFLSGASAPGTVVSDTATPFTTVTSYSTKTVVAGTITSKETLAIPVAITASAELASFTTSISTSTQTSTTTNASAASQTTAGHAVSSSSSSKTSTLIPAIVVPVVVVLLTAAFVGFWFLMRRRHYRAIEEQAKFEKVGAPMPVDDNSSNARLVEPVVGVATNNKPKGAVNVQVKALPEKPLARIPPPRPLRLPSPDIPASAIGVAQSTSGASAAPSYNAFKAPGSSHSTRERPLNPHERLNASGPRSPALSGTDIIDAYAALHSQSPSPRPSTANISREPAPPPRSSSKNLPSKPTLQTQQPSPAPRPPPSYNTSTQTQSPSAYTYGQARSSPTTQRPFINTSDRASPALTEENLRIARLGDGTFSSLSRHTAADNASVSDIDEEQYHVRAPSRDDHSDISSLNEDDEEWAAGLHSGRNTPGYAR